ncbi:sterol desaturase family protein [Brunnivagina elsteri]|uniref:sterol desaturase family protein n=1 Tax=Brunnivagina elsteri TaxID=1247191 RepID=UPI001FE79CB3|nr:sterol desaturase family protein [Calothrix elsteri]
MNSLTIAFLLHQIWQQKFWLGFLHLVELPWLAATISFVIIDLYMYVWHRLMHSSNITWQFHQVHHTEMSMNTSTAYRFHTVEVILSNVPKLFLIWLLGIKPSYLLFYEITLAIELIFHHSNWALPWKLDKFLSYLIVTPNIHRLHHSQSFQDTQFNYASILTIWDKLFHTCSYPKYPEKIQLGLTEYRNHLNILNLIFLPLRKH